MAPRRRLTAAVMTVALIVGATGTAAASEQVTNHTSRAAVAGTVAQQHSVFRLYRAYFLRDPEPAGHAYWVGRYASGKSSLPAISQFFSQSSEFKNRYGSLTNTDFVNLVYMNVLGRTPDAAGLRHWVALLDAGQPRGVVMVGFSESPEFQRKTKTVAPAPPSDTGSAWDDEVMAKLNGARAQAGVAAVRLCPALMRSALGHSVDQAARNTLTHTGSNGSDPGARMQSAGYNGARAWSENVAAGYPDIDSVVAAWMASPAHRQNLLGSGYEHFGIAKVVASNGTPYWTLDLGAGGTC
ncbi:MAG: DUF4214 domain-containing protein [Aquihabitans sp.]